MDERLKLFYWAVVNLSTEFIHTEGSALGFLVCFILYCYVSYENDFAGIPGCELHCGDYSGLKDVKGLIISIRESVKETECSTLERKGAQEAGAHLGKMYTDGKVCCWALKQRVPQDCVALHADAI